MGDAVIVYSTAGGSVSKVLGTWALVGGAPFALGRTLATRSALALELQANADLLRDEELLRAQRAAGEERTRMARELHDVIAHCVSVMVVQTAAARRVSGVDAGAARRALAAVEHAGREALVELRRIVGVLRREPDDATDMSSPGLSGLEALVARARDGGLSVELHVEGPRTTVPRGADLVAYRIVQEGLTNAIKHAGPARATVTVCVGPSELALTIADDGRGPVERSETGHGLVGMRERVALYGGELHAGPRVGANGYEVRARIPLDGTSAPARSASPPPVNIAADNRSPELRWPWLDPALAGLLLVGFGVAVVTSDNRHGPLAVNLLLAAAAALIMIWRRRSPLVYLLVTGGLVLLSRTLLTGLGHSALTGAYLALVPAYTIAAWTNRGEAIAGLAIMLGGAAIEDRASAGTFAGAAFAVSAAWAAGRAIRDRRLLTARLESTSARLVAEREDRARLAVAAERTRIARDLHGILARSVSAMVVQAEAAAALLSGAPEQADAAMDSIESTGREALREMRRLLGALRGSHDRIELAPAPGVEQIYSLILGAREDGQQVELTVDGKPGTLSRGLDLAIYRILDDALAAARHQAARPIAVLIRFGALEIELELTADRGEVTDAMRERIAVCGGRMHAAERADGRWGLAVQLPRTPEAMLA
jgi:signal transduction histidine kinase